MGHAGMSRFPPHLYLERTAADRLDERHSGSSPREVLKQAVFGFLSDHGDPSDLVEESAVSLMMKGRCDSVGPQNGATVELVGALVLEKILRLLWIWPPARGPGRAHC
ncbi:unnamed protein product [Gadus morhua 'NCC']